MKASKALKRGQAGVIGGIIILAIIFSIAVPLLIHYQKGSETIVTKMSEKVNVAYERLNEKLDVQGVPLTSENILADLVPGVFINNTGTQPATVKRLWLLWKNGTIFAIIDLANYTASNLVERITLNPGTPQETLLQPGQLPTLQPGETMHIKLTLTLEEAQNLAVYAETTRSILHPRTEMPSDVMPPATEAGGGGGEGAGWKGLYMPVTGLKYVGYDEITRYARVEEYVPPIRIHAYGYDIWGSYREGIEFASSFIFDDPDYPGLYMIVIEVRYGYSWYQYLEYDIDPTGAGGTLDLPNTYYLIIKGFVGTYTVNQHSDGYQVTVIHGRCFEVYIDPDGEIGPSDTPVISYPDPVQITGQPWDRIDLDENGVPELVYYTSMVYYGGADNDADEDGYSLSDSGVLQVMFTQDITQADFIRVNVKLTYSWVMTFYSTAGAASGFRQLRIASIMLFEYNETTNTWHLRHYKDYWFVDSKPITIVFEATFPVERTKIYRVVVYLYDPYRSIPLDDQGLVFDDPTYPDSSRNTYSKLDFTIGLEHVVIEYGIVNPFLEKIPPVYLLAIPTANYTYLGDGTVENLTELFTDLLTSLGINSYILIDSFDKMQTLLLEDPPMNAIIFNLHGGTIPVPDRNTYDWLTLHDYIVNNHWVWVNVLVGPPVPGTDYSYWYLADPTGMDQLTSNLALTYLTNNPNVIQLVYYPSETNLTDQGKEIKAKLLALDLPDQATIQWQFQGVADPIPYYIAEISGVNQTYSLAIPARDYSGIQQAYLVITGFGPLNWTTPTQDEASPELATRTAVYFALHAWLQLTSS